MPAANACILICIDSYESGNPRGRLHNRSTGDSSFDSLSQMLLLVEEMLEDLQSPQSYTACRSFSHLVQPMQTPPGSHRPRRGQAATFELRILFRQHTSWQGVLLWQEQQREQSFRSALEMILLMDSALRGLEHQLGA